MDWTIIFFSIVFSAFFSGMEIAFVSSNKLRLELATKETGAISRILLIFSNNPSKYISAMLVGNNLALVIYGIFMAKLLEGPISVYTSNVFAILLSQIFLSTLIILVFAEFIPQTLFRIISNKALKTFSFPLIVFYYVFYPIVAFSIWMASGIMRIFANIEIDDREKEKAFGKLDIEEILENTKDSDNQSGTTQELKIFQNALDFSKIKLRECIIPRNKIVAVSNDTELSDLRDKFIESGHSNILVYKDNVDEISGYINVKDIFKNPQRLRNILRQVLIVPETMSAKKLFEQLIKTNKSLAVVVDEFGSTSGMVTVEDIMEEIFGEFEDEHDAPEINVQITDEGNYILSGKQEVDVLNEEYGLDLSESDEYETIAGYILYHTGNFPKQGTSISIFDNEKKYKFKILKIQDTKIEKVLLYDPS